MHGEQQIISSCGMPIQIMRFMRLSSRGSCVRYHPQSFLPTHTYLFIYFLDEDAILIFFNCLRNQTSRARQLFHRRYSEPVDKVRFEKWVFAQKFSFIFSYHILSPPPKKKKKNY